MATVADLQVSACSWTSTPKKPAVQARLKSAAERFNQLILSDDKKVAGTTP
jgi:hypothetical protein